MVPANTTILLLELDQNQELQCYSHAAGFGDCLESPHSPLLQDCELAENNQVCQKKVGLSNFFRLHWYCVLLLQSKQLPMPTLIYRIKE